jgi:DNA-binding NarL/FixJ family response regulator
MIADDHAMVREGLQALLHFEPEFRVVGQAADGDETLRLVRSLKPHLLLLDLAMPRRSGLEVLCELNLNSSPLRVILLVASIERAQIVEALQLGAHGIVMKEAAPDLLFKAMRAVMSGQYWIGRESVADLLQVLRLMSQPAAQNHYRMTARERQVLSEIVAGATNHEIAEKLAISEETVKHHLTSLFDKLGVSNRLELAIFAISHNLISK